MDEARLVAERRADLGDRLDVDGRLVAPARLFVGRGVRGVEGADGSGRIAGRSQPGTRCERDAQFVLVHAEVAPARVGLDGLDQLVGVGFAPAGVELDQGGQEVRLGRDRKLGMRVQHQPQKRRSRAPDSHDEGRGLVPITHARESRWGARHG